MSTPILFSSKPLLVGGSTVLPLLPSVSGVDTWGLGDFRRFNEPGPPTYKGIPATKKKYKTNKYSEKVCEQWDCNLQHCRPICFSCMLHSA